MLETLIRRNSKGMINSVARAQPFKTAIITGAGRGIGAATARLLAQKGFQTVLVSRTRSELEVTAKNILNLGMKSCIVTADLTDETQIDLVFETAVKAFGSVDVLINNAAKVEVAEIFDQSTASFDQLMALNVRAPYLCARRAFHLMKKQGTGGSIVNISSLGGIQSTEKFKGLSAYTTSKSALIGMTEALAVEGRPFKIRVNAVAPGAVDTQMLHEAAPFLKTETKPEDIAKIIAMLCDDEQSSALNGSIIEIHSNQ